MRENEEIILQNKLIIRQDLIEEGLCLIERETVIGNTRKRCDILFRDRLGRYLFVEVKEQIDEKAITQILDYRHIVSDLSSRFMLVSNYPINEKYRKKLTDSQIEYKWINKKDIDINTNMVFEIQKGNSKYKTKETIFNKLNKERKIAEDIYYYVTNNLHNNYMPILCNISDGLMFQLIDRNEKFLSISTIGNRLLFHFPYGNRNVVFTKFKSSISEIYCFRDKYPDKVDKERNQIDIKLKDVKSLEYVKPLIDEAYHSSINYNYEI